MPYTLLLADDSVTIQRVIELTFADEDVQVVAVSDGDQAIARLEASPPDIVLADIGMPGRNGYEVAQYIKQSPRLAHIPVMLLTGAFEPVDQARASEAGCDGVLAKPFEPQLVISRVKELLARPRQDVDAFAATTARAADRWSPAPIPTAVSTAPAPVSTEPAPAPLPALDMYFDRLNAAFSSRAAEPAPAPVKESTPSMTPSPLPDEIDWFGAAKNDPAAPAPEWDLPGLSPMAEPPDLPLSISATGAFTPEATPGALPAPVEGPPPVERAAPIAVAPPTSIAQATPAETLIPVTLPAPVAPPAPVEPPAPVVHALPSIADAFAALLAAEQGERWPPIAAVWPASGPSASLAADEVVEQVTRRVLDQLSDRIVRETVADLVSSIAERLVREEIERIKASIQ